MWTWARDRRFPELAEWFNQAVAAGLVLVCDLVALELLRLTPNEHRARDVSERLSAFEPISLSEDLWADARRLQLVLAAAGDHRRVPPADLLLASAARRAGVEIVHYDRDYERIAAVSDLQHLWFVPACRGQEPPAGGDGHRHRGGSQAGHPARDARARPRVQEVTGSPVGRPGRR